jgi:hypothetical protein
LEAIVRALVKTLGGRSVSSSSLRGSNACFVQDRSWPVSAR